MKDLVTKIKKTIRKECEAFLLARLQSKFVTTPTKEVTKNCKPMNYLRKYICQYMWTIERNTTWTEVYNGNNRSIEQIYIINSHQKQNEETIDKVIQNQWVLKYGAPKEIHVDCGKSFESHNT